MDVLDKEPTKMVLKLYTQEESWMYVTEYERNLTLKDSPKIIKMIDFHKGDSETQPLAI